MDQWVALVRSHGSLIGGLGLALAAPKRRLEKHQPFTLQIWFWDG